MWWSNFLKCRGSGDLGLCGPQGQLGYARSVHGAVDIEGAMNDSGDGGSLACRCSSARLTDFRLRLLLLWFRLKVLEGAEQPGMLLVPVLSPGTWAL